jgi:hypothetical protein
VIAILSTYFVPVWHGRDDYQVKAPSAPERAELLRLDRERGKGGLPGGTVCVMLVTPEGAVAAAQPVQQACHAQNLLPFLETFVRNANLRPRDPAAVQAARVGVRSARPDAGKGGLVLHTWARADDVDPNRGNSQDWVTWTAAECATLLPTAGAAAGASWTVPRAVADKLFACCYPPGPSWSITYARVTAGQLAATALRVSPTEVYVRLEGQLALLHPAEGKETDRRVRARVLGFLRYDPQRQAITSFVLASEQANSVWYWQGQPQPKRLLFAAAREGTE